ncbi:alpha/beta hydrolase [Lactiplantibacillus plantarum]|uniref:Alpha/beta hydrolase n=1 Tax=Lactiplantibacillus plantarum CMPG5300 TaxID=1304889 RepID=A0AAW3FPY3_LACPN|nr:alpha/beta hydrolase [Lactiplantibacillus plantarum]ALF13915.1 hypothetical protein AKJ11_01910 [Lactiplantibacillus plantarum]ANM72910.1 hypothetical protein A8P51_00165 [Lactiplantibacillus plantarum]ARW35137.1 Haloalkane dehalogenase [Lactiplantibacillus plantarum]ATI71014.1 alpha/beta hydrolase [Lactiplantibacillus plantarum]KGH43299.1 Alpha/beta hydrolase [Lactiplantibacillus plantarum CMPG5300]
MINNLNKKKQIVGNLAITYLEAGPESGQTIILFHGFPDSPTSYGPLMEQLVQRGYRVIAPYLRGYAPTTLLNLQDKNTGDIETLAEDAIRFFDALNLDKAIVVGQDWGSAIAEILTIAREQKIQKLVKLNWYGIYMMAKSQKAASFDYTQLSNSWYIWMLNTRMGEMVLQYDAIKFSYALWRQWTPQWNSSQEQLFETAKTSFQTPEFCEVVLSAYRNGLNPAVKETALHRLIMKLPPIKVRTIVLTGSRDPVESSLMSKKSCDRYFIGPFEHRVIAGAGHFIHHQNTDDVLSAIIS